MKTLITLLSIASLSLACQHALIPKGWVIDPKTVASDSAMVDGKLEPWMKAVVYMNYVCSDSLIQAKKDSIAAKAKK